MADSTPFSFRMDPALRRRLSEHGRRNQRNLTQTINYLLLRALDQEQAHPGSVHDTAGASDHVGGGTE